MGRFSKKQLLLLACVVLIVASIPLGIFLLRQQQNIRSRASTGSCGSDVSNTPIETYCQDNLVVKVYEYTDNNQCKIFLEPTSESCQTTSPSPTSGPSSTPIANMYDLNSDGVINSFDVGIFLNGFRGGQYLQRFDFNSDQVVNSIDFGYLLRAFRNL